MTRELAIGRQEKDSHPAQDRTVPGGAGWLKLLETVARYSAFSAGFSVPFLRRSAA